ncbi:hypothetical protein TDB9533_03918 [Thalassocella blandensis]|nr:hypothetical protein TDB9533_03918 [Thalassocella blandensis]
MFRKVFFKSHPLKVKSFLVSSVFATVLGVAFSFSSQGASNTKDLRTQHSALIENASLTSCIDKTGLANEIEITGRAMKKAVNDVLGYPIKPVVEREEKVVYCALNLV